MNAAGTLDIRVFVFGEDREEVQERAAAFLDATREAAPYGASVRGHRLYPGLPAKAKADFTAAVDELLREAA